MAMESHNTTSPSTRVGIRAFGLSRRYSALCKIVGLRAGLYQFIWLAHLLEHPQASRRPGSGVTIQLKHHSAPKRLMARTLPLAALRSD